MQSEPRDWGFTGSPEDGNSNQVSGETDPDVPSAIRENVSFVQIVTRFFLGQIFWAKILNFYTCIYRGKPGRPMMVLVVSRHQQNAIKLRRIPRASHKSDETRKQIAHRI